MKVKNMTKFILSILALVTIFSSAFATENSQAEYPCIEKAVCYKALSNSCEFGPLTSEQLKECASIPSYVYIKAIFYNAKGVRKAYTSVDSLWYYKVGSTIGGAVFDAAFESKKRVYQKASNACNAAVDNLYFKFPKCK